MSEPLTHATHREFVEHYSQAHAGPKAHQRLVALRDMVQRFTTLAGEPLDVADIGCAAGAQSIVWAANGHRVHALDISADLLEVARQRASEAGFDIDCRLGSATDIPWANESMDVCLVVELLEHVADWSRCLSEFARIVRPGGVLLITTTNVLCPRQQEFSLPLYSWYPGPIKRHCERLASTTRPALAGYATYPALHWFSFYGLRRALRPYGFQCLDRFDVMDLGAKGHFAGVVVGAIRRVPILRWLAHVATSYSLVLAVKEGRR